VCRQNPDIRPAAVVIVASLKALKMHGGMSKDLIKTTKDLKALEAGMVNLKRHVETVKMYGLPVVIAVNRFPDDCYGELCFVKEYCEKELSVRAEISNVVEEGGAGGEALADAVIEAAETKSEFKLLYGDNLTIKEKIEQIAKKVYRAGKVSYSIKAEKDIAAYEKSGFSDLAINIAKTQLSTTDTPNIYGAPEGFTFNVREVKPSLGAGFLVVIAGEMMTLPGLPKVPSANMIDIDDNGNITGLH